MHSFRGGVHPLHAVGAGKRLTQNLPIRDMDIPALLVYPMVRGAGAPATPLVAKSDRVAMGQKIGEPSGFISAAVHATVSGTVRSVEPRPHPGGGYVLAVVVENDGQYTPVDTAQPLGADASAGEIVAAVRELGIVGMGGATFPTHVKLMPPKDAVIDTLILNGAECEPYLTADHRLMLEQPARILRGADIVARVLPGIRRVIVGIELNKRDAIRAMRDAASGRNSITVSPLRVKYPQGAEKQLIWATTRRKVPTGGLPSAVGVVVMNVGTAAALADAIDTGMPTLTRVVTVSGDAVREPANLRVRIGTSFDDCIAACGGAMQAAKLIAGGPMMGIALPDGKAPVHAGTSGILLLSAKAAARPAPANCLRCGRCVAVCPIGLMPLHIAQTADRGEFDLAQRLHAMDCIECGSCSYICPAHRYLLQSIRLAKSQIRSKARK